VVVCLVQGADLHMAQLMPLPLTVSCFSKIQIGSTFLVLAHLGSPRKGPLNGCVCVIYICGNVFAVQNKTCVQTLEGHAQNISCVAFHPELPIILTGSEDGEQVTLLLAAATLCCPLTARRQCR